MKWVPLALLCAAAGLIIASFFLASTIGLISLIAADLAAVWLATRVAESTAARDIGTTCAFLLVGLIPHILFILNYEGDAALANSGWLYRYESLVVWLSDWLSGWTRLGLALVAMLMVFGAVFARNESTKGKILWFAKIPRMASRIGLAVGSACWFTVFATMDSHAWTPDTNARLRAILTLVAEERAKSSIAFELASSLNVKDDFLNQVRIKSHAVVELVSNIGSELGPDEQSAYAKNEAERAGLRIGGDYSSTTSDGSLEAKADAIEPETPPSRIEGFYSLHQQAQELQTARHVREAAIYSLTGVITSVIPEIEIGDVKVIRTICDEAVSKIAETMTTALLSRLSPKDLREFSYSPRIKIAKAPEPERSVPDTRWSTRDQFSFGTRERTRELIERLRFGQRRTIRRR
jgi:hypothetical protein